ncbi:MAG: LytTR family DNA-binding domain-containing protein [Bacteroidota bacterium]
MIKCIIVDDELPSIVILSTLIEKFPQKLSLIQTFQEAEKALDYLQINPIDLIFSDIKMNKMSGLEFAGKVNGTAKIIFTTAHKDFGADSYDYNALDFLQKPIDFERFKKAIDKIPEKIIHTDGTFFVKDGFKKVNVNVNEVTFIEASDGYLKIHNKNKKETILTLNSLNELEKQLKPYNFHRIHNSHMVHLPFITSYDANYVEIDLGNEIKMLPISNSYRNQFLSAMPMLGK